MEPEKALQLRQQADDAPIVESFSLPDHSTLKIALEPGYSIQFDDLPKKFQIRIMDKRSRSPQRIRNVDSPGSSQWMTDYGPPRWDADSSRVVRGQARQPPSPSTSSEQMQEELREDLSENAAPVGFRETTCEDCGAVKKEVTEERFFLRRPSAKYLSTVEERRNSLRPSAFISSDFFDCQRPSQNFLRNNLTVDGLDLHEIHSNLKPHATSQEQPQTQATPQLQSQRSERAKMPPDEAYSAAKYSSPPESPRSASPGRCSWHRGNSCPVTAGYRCRENTGFESSLSDRLGGGGLDSEGDRCSYHRNLSCPATAGVRCRSERSISPPTDRKEGLRPSREKGLIFNSCKCEGGRAIRPSEEQILASPPHARDVPLPSCHCQRGHS